jgi:hypothetical protein
VSKALSIEKKVQEKQFRNIIEKKQVSSSKKKLKNIITAGEF